MKLNLLGDNGSKQVAKKEKSESENRRKLRSARLLTFLFFLSIAFVFWVLQRLQGDFVRPLSIPIVYDTVAQDNSLAKDLPQEIRLSVQDKGFEHLRYGLNPIEPIRLSIQKDDKGKEYIGLGKTALQVALEKRLSGSALILQQSHREIRIPIVKRTSKKVPVRLAEEPNTKAGFTASSVRCTPDSVVVVGAEEVLSKLTFVHTAQLAEKALEADLQTTVGILLPQGVESKTTLVTLDIKVEELTEQSFVLPIQVVGISEGYILHPLPNTVNVSLTFPRSRYSSTTSQEVEATIDYSNIISTPSEQGSEYLRQLPVRLTKCPKWVKRYSITPEYVQFVLEKV